MSELAEWLAERLPGPGEPQIATLHQTAGRTHDLRIVARGERRWVLRIGESFTVDRERRLLAALAGTTVPHPKLVLRSDASAPMDKPFLLLEYVDGVTLDGEVPAAYDDAEGARQLTDAIVDALAEIAGVDWQASALGGFGRPDGYLERQVAKAQRMLAGARARDTPQLDALLDALDRNLPAHYDVGLLHGDYSTLNLRASMRQPRIVAVLDWETATIGDPLIDIGYLTARWVGAEQNPLFAAFTLRGALPPASYLAERYAQATGRCLDRLPFYQGLAMARLAVALEVRLALGGDGAAGFGALADTVVQHGLMLMNR